MLVGGPTGGFLPPEALDTPLSHEPVARRPVPWPARAPLLALDDSTCLVDLATLMTRYLNDQACGKTIPCRIGTRRLAELGGGICVGHGRPSDAALVVGPGARTSATRRSAAWRPDASNPLLSGMRYFASEFEDHIVRGRCPAGVCQPVACGRRGARMTHRPLRPTQRRQPPDAMTDTLPADVARAPRTTSPSACSRPRRRSAASSRPHSASRSTGAR